MNSKKNGKRTPKMYVYVVLILMFVLIGLVFGFVFVMLQTFQK